jgi:hypothetical protein
MQLYIKYVIYYNFDHFDNILITSSGLILFSRSKTNILYITCNILLSIFLIKISEHYFFIIRIPWVENNFCFLYSSLYENWGI